MDALILSCGTGGGHDAAAKAIQEALTARGHRSLLLNPYTLKGRGLARAIDQSYIKTARNVPRLFGLVYHAGDLYSRLPIPSPVYLVNGGMVRLLADFLQENHFDVILTTHLFPAEMITGMKRRGIPMPPSIFVATDYVCTPFVGETTCDAYVIPAPDLSNDFIRKGIPGKKLHPLGIPTRAAFAQAEDKREVKRRLGLDPDRKMLLVTGGSMGGGTMKKAVASLCRYARSRKDLELVFICGSNRALEEALRKKALPAVTVLGHTDDMPTYLKAADLFISKPGGLSSSEAAAVGVPLLHTAPIPGCENDNARYFSSHGMGLSGPITPAMLRRVDAILSDPALGGAMIDRQKKGLPQNAADQICLLAERTLL